MRKSHFLTLIWVLVCGSAYMEAQAQPILKYTSRSEIEACPQEEKKRPVLQLLDESRDLADRSVRLFAEGRVKELYALMSTSFRNKYTEPMFPEYLGASNQGEGKERHYEYRNQIVMDCCGSPDEIDAQSDSIIVSYALAGGTGIVLRV